MQNLKEYLDENYPEHDIVIADGFDEAFIGVGKSFNRVFACYDKEKVFDILMRDNMTHVDAAEYFEFNIGGAYVGENTPVFIERRD